MNLPASRHSGDNTSTQVCTYLMLNSYMLRKSPQKRRWHIWQTHAFLNRIMFCERIECTKLQQSISLKMHTI